MNKVHKVVRCKVTGQMLVVSELAKNHGKLASTTKVVTTHSKLPSANKFAGAFALSMLGIGAAWANCTGASTAATITGNLTDSTTCLNESEVNVNNANITVDNTIGSINGIAAINVVQNGSPTVGTIINVTDSTIASSALGGGTSSLGMGIKGTTVGDVTINFSGTNSINIDDNNGTALLGNSSAGNSTINIQGRFDLTSGGTASAAQESDGIESISTSGNATIKHTGIGTIDVTGGNAVYARVAGATGDVNITLKGNNGANSIELKTAGNTSTLRPSKADGHYGISAALDDINNTTGQIFIDTDAKISTSGSTSYGIKTFSSTGNQTIINAGDISTTGHNASGIYAEIVNSTGNNVGQITIENSGNVQTINNNISDPNTPLGNPASRAIFALIDSKGDSGGIKITQTGGILSSTGYDSHGILALTKASSGDIDVVVNNTIIDLKAHNSDGIDVQRVNTGNDNDISNVNINITTNNGEIKLLDNPTSINGGANYGIVAHQYNAAKGNINITNNGTKISTGVGQNGSGVNSDAINAVFKAATAEGNIVINNHGQLSTLASEASGIKTINEGSGNIFIGNANTIQIAGESANAIYASNGATDTGNITVINTSHVSTTGDKASAIFTNAKSDVEILNTGTITTNGTDPGFGSHGIETVIGHSGRVNIINNGTVDIQGLASKGIMVTGGTNSIINVTNNGIIHHDDDTAYQYGIEIKAGTDATHIINNNGRVTGGNFGIVAWNGATAHTGGKSEINIGSQGFVDSINAITADMSDKNTINIAQGGLVNGKLNALLLRGYEAISIADNTVNNFGTITSDQDVILRTEFTGSGAKIKVNNGTTGEMTGVFTHTGTPIASANVHNEGAWNLRKIADVDRDGVRDTKQAAISDFGTGSNTSIINASSGTLKLGAVTQNGLTVDTTNQYVPVGALSMAHEGIVHGQLLNTRSFDNRGKIDLTGNGLAGDVLAISGSGIAGIYDPLSVNTFTSNGGSLHLDSVLNKGGSISQSDVLVLDNVAVGSGGATKVRINAVGGNGALTEGEGIKIIEVLGQNNAGAFTSDGPITHGFYEYSLVRGSGANANNWYLRNSEKSSSPVAGAYLNTQYAAGHMFNQSIVDRRDAVWTPDSNIWARVKHSVTNMDTIKRTQETEIKTTMVQFGGDIAHWNDVSLGLFGGYGSSDIDSKSKYTGSKASAKVDGYHVGMYGSWIPEVENGLYADFWGQYAWFDNKLTGKAQHNGNVKYDSSAITFSAELGYATQVTESENKNWMLEPHAQVMYTIFDADNFKDNNNTYFSDGKGDGLRSRLGARFYGMEKDNVGLSPFVEANWLHDATNNKVKLLGKQVDAGGAKNIAEMKLGLEGHINKNFSIWTHIGGQWGEKKYNRYEGQVGLGYKW